MNLLNTTFFIDKPVGSLFIDWAKNHYIPELEKFGGQEIKFLEITSDEPDALRYAIQTVLQSENQSQQWQDSMLPAILQKAFGNSYAINPDQLLHFTSVMHIL